MNELRALELRIVQLEHRINVHSENLATVFKRIDEHGDKLNDIRTIILQVKWLFVGSMVFFTAQQTGILPALAKAFGV